MSNDDSYGKPPPDDMVVLRAEQEKAEHRKRNLEMAFTGISNEELAQELIRRRCLYSVQGSQAYYNEVAKVDAKYLEHIDKDIAQMVGRALLAQDLLTFVDEPYSEKGQASKRLGHVFVLKETHPVNESKADRFGRPIVTRNN